MKKADNRSKWLHLRLSNEEHKFVIEKRAKSLCRNLSQYLRNVIFDRPIVTTYRNLSLDHMLQQLAVLNKELNALGNNLNQITKKLHTLQAFEKQRWASEYSLQAESINSKIDEVKELVNTISKRWLR